MKKTTGIILVMIITLLGLIGLGSAAMVVNLYNSSVSVTTQTPNLWYNVTNGTGFTASCSLYMGGATRATNSSVNNDTTTVLAPSSAMGYYSYNDVFVTCTNGTNTNTSKVITVNIASHSCVGAESVFTWAITGVLMISIAAFIILMVASGNPDPKLIIGVVVAAILLLIMLAIVNPLAASVCA